MINFEDNLSESKRTPKAIIFLEVNNCNSSLADKMPHRVQKSNRYLMDFLKMIF